MRDKYVTRDDWGEQVSCFSLKEEEYLLGLDDGPQLPCCWFVWPKPKPKPTKKIQDSDLLFFKSVYELNNPGQLLKRLKREGKL